MKISDFYFFYKIIRLALISYQRLPIRLPDLLPEFLLHW